MKKAVARSGKLKERPCTKKRLYAYFVVSSNHFPRSPEFGRGTSLLVPVPLKYIE